MKQKEIITLAAIGLGAIFLFRAQAAKAVEAVANVNQGTPFEGYGVTGTLGNAANTASGGVLENIGSAIGNWFADLRGY